jgi:hypothetical protein
MNPEHKMPGGITGKGFVAGDQRINRCGRPAGFDELRRKAQELLWQDVPWADGRMISRIEFILRRWSRSKKFREQMYFMEIAFGPVPPAKVEAESLKPGTVLRLHWPHELRRP